MREALSIEFASGGLTALGSKAKECLFQWMQSRLLHLSLRIGVFLWPNQ